MGTPLRPILLLAFAAGALGACTNTPPAADASERVSCWNVSVAGGPTQVLCRNEQEWARILASNGVQCEDGPAVRGMCPEYWRERNRLRSLASSITGFSRTTNGGVKPVYEWPYGFPADPANYGGTP